MSKDIGGSAFPDPSPNDEDSPTGMTLRDWFAGQAIIGGLTVATSMAAQGIASNEHGLAEDCYKIADSLIAEKRRTEGEK